MTLDRDLEALLGEVRTVHEPTPADRQRVREALSDALVLQQLAKPAGPDVRRRRGEYLRLVLGSGGSTLVGVMTLGAAAAAAVVALAYPGSKLGERLGNSAALSEAKPERMGLASAGASMPRQQRLSTTGTLEVQAEPRGATGCAAWPCLESEPRRVLTLGGTELAEPDSASVAPRPDSASESVERDSAEQSDVASKHRLEVTPALALDIAPGRVTPGASLRVAVPVTKQEDVALEVTLQHFPMQDAGGLLAGGLGICWRPIGGKLEASLCGRMGYESGTTKAPAEAGDDPWRLTAGASAELVWNLTRELGAYTAFEGALPLATSAGAERSLGMRVMAGPRLSF